MGFAGGRGFTVKVNQRQIERLLSSPQGPLVSVLGQAAEVVAQGAKRRAPVSPRGSGGRPSGYLRSSIGWQIEQGPLRARIGSNAFTAEGTEYGYIVEVGSRAHVIRARRAPALYFFWPKVGGFVSFKSVNHPGTPAQPYLRPALDDLAGRRFR